MNPEIYGFNPEQNKPDLSLESKREGGLENVQEYPPEVRKSHDQLETLAKNLRESTSFERQKLEDGRELIVSPEGEKYYIRQITDPKDPVVKPMHDLLKREFGRDEVEPLGWVRISIRDGLYAYHVMEDEDGKVFSMTVTQSLELEPDNSRGGEQLKETMLAEWYIHTNPASKISGPVSRQLFASAADYALNNAREKGAKFSGFVGEMVSSVELFMNRAGHKRMYYEDTEGNVVEVPYACPPSDFDTKTGEAGSDIYPEHIMLRLLDNNQEMDVEDVLRLVKSMWREYVARPEDYDSKEAYNQAKSFTDKMLEDLSVKFSQAKDGKVFFMSARERKEKIKELAVKGNELIETVTEDDES